MVERVASVVVPLPSRESVEAKARRYLLDGRLHILSVHHGRIRAECRGAGAIYRLGYSEQHWWCDCPARGRCAHLGALQLVVDAPAPGDAA